MTGVREDAAYRLGRAACVLSQPRQPAMDGRMLELLDGVPIDRRRPLVAAWLDGFDQAANATLAR